MTMTQESLPLKDLFQSSDLAISAAISLFYPIETIDTTNPYKATFLFKREVGLEQLVEAYWKGEMRVDPQRYFSQLKQIKTRLYELRRTSHE